NSPQEPIFKKKDQEALITSILFLVIGLIILWLAKTVLDISGDGVLISLLLIPVFIYVITSGRVKEFKGPGGVAATFFETASQPVKVASEKVEPSIAEMQIVEKASMQDLERKKHELNET